MTKHSRDMQVAVATAAVLKSTWRTRESARQRSLRRAMNRVWSAWQEMMKENQDIDPLFKALKALDKLIGRRSNESDT